MDRLVVVKVLTAVDAEATRRRFDRERKAMGRLSQAPGIVPLYGSGFTPAGQPWLLMPYYENGSLQNVIDAAGPMDPERARQIGVRVSRAVHAAHENGVLHRDLKPANVLVSRSGQPDVADFGIAHLLDETLGMSQALTMTPLYTAPEVFDGADSGTAGDVYSLGALLYALLAGRPAYSTDREQISMLALMRRVHEEPLPALPAHVPPALASIVHRAMDKDPAARPATAAALADLLVRADLTAAPTPPVAPRAQGPASAASGRPPQAPKPAAGIAVSGNGRRTGLLAGAALVVLLLAVGGAVLMSRVQSNDGTTDNDRGVVDGPDVGITVAPVDTATPVEGDPDDNDTDGGFNRVAALKSVADSLVEVEGFSCTGAQRSVGVLLDDGTVLTDVEILRSPWYVSVTRQGVSYRAIPETMDLNRRLGLVDVSGNTLPTSTLGSIEPGDTILLAESSAEVWETPVATNASQKLVADLPLSDALRVDHAVPGFDDQGTLVAIALEADDELGLMSATDIFEGWNNAPPRTSCPSLVRDLDGGDAAQAVSPEIQELLLLQGLSDALADEDWDTVRTREPGKASLSDDQFVAGWRPLRQGFVYPVSRTALDADRSLWRLGLIGHETWNGTDLTTLFCVSWEVDRSTSEIVQTNQNTVRLFGSQPGETQRAGFEDPSNLIGRIDETCPL
jgi:hypothetical protein